MLGFGSERPGVEMLAAADSGSGAALKAIPEMGAGDREVGYRRHRTKARYDKNTSAAAERKIAS